MISSPEPAGAFRRATPSDVQILAELCRRAAADAPDAEELRWALLDDEQPAWLAGDGHTGAVVVTHSGDGTGYVRLLVVDPAVRRGGLGSELLSAALAHLADAPVVEVGGDAPFYLYPGVPVGDLAMLCLLEKHGFRRTGVRLNLAVDPHRLAELDSSGVRAAVPSDEPAVGQFLGMHYPEYAPEALRALRRGTLCLRTDADRSVVGIGAHSVSRKGWLGPIAVAPGDVGRGRGRALLAALGGRLLDSGHRGDAVLEWVGPVRPYARLGARILTTYAVHRAVKD